MKKSILNGLIRIILTLYNVYSKFKENNYLGKGINFEATTTVTEETIKE
mgnify:CR=1 FL=1